MSAALTTKVAAPRVTVILAHGHSAADCHGRKLFYLRNQISEEKLL